MVEGVLGDGQSRNSTELHGSAPHSSVHTYGVKWDTRRRGRFCSRVVSCFCGVGVLRNVSIVVVRLRSAVRHGAKPTPYVHLVDGSHNIPKHAMRQGR